MKVSLKGYIRYLRKQHMHIQRVHAAVLAGIICFVLGSAILYAQYGFWHTTYVRGEDAVENSKDSTVLTESPFETLSRLIKEGKGRFSGVTDTLKPFTGGQITFDRNGTTKP